jgi:hypothetical protein
LLGKENNMKLEELEAIRSRVREEYSEDRWITLIDPCGDNLPPDTYEAGYNAACQVVFWVLCEFLNEEEQQ